MALAADEASIRGEAALRCGKAGYRCRLRQTDPGCRRGDQPARQIVRIRRVKGRAPGGLLAPKNSAARFSGSSYSRRAARSATS